MHGVEGTFHGFVELSPDSYVAFVQHPDNGKDIELGVTHAGSAGGPVTRGTMQHVALHVDKLEDVYEMRDRVRSRGIQVMGPIDHGFCQSMYFAGPEGLSLEICTGSSIDERAWIDPEVQRLCGISDEELEGLKDPVAFERPAEPVPQPATDPSKPAMMYPNPSTGEMIMSMSDEDTWDRFSETIPPVIVD